MGPSSDRRADDLSRLRDRIRSPRRCRGRSPRPRGSAHGHAKITRTVRAASLWRARPLLLPPSIPPFYNDNTKNNHVHVHLRVHLRKSDAGRVPGVTTCARGSIALRAAAPQHATTDPTARDLSYRRTRAAPEGTWRVRGVKDTRSQRLRQAQKRVRQPRTQVAAG